MQHIPPMPKPVTGSVMAHGKSFVQAQHDYRYTTSDGREIAIKKDEVFLLLKKTNQYWWRVMAHGEKERKPIYVPAAYVRPIEKGMVRRGSEGDSSAPAESSSDARESSAEAYTSSDEPTVVLSDKEQDPVDCEQPDIPAPQPVQKTDGGELPETDYDNSEKESDDEAAVVPNGTTPAPDYDATSEEEQSEFKWEEHTDAQTGNKYYHNPATKESRWAAREPPKGWSETKTPEGVCYWNAGGNEKWYRHVDAAGKEYFYTEDGQTCWQLPELSSEPPSGPARRFTPAYDEHLVNFQRIHRNSVVKEPMHFSPSRQPPKMKRGPLHRYKSMDPNSKSKKQWEKLYAVMEGTTLSFFKDEKAAEKVGGEDATRRETCLSQNRLSTGAKSKAEFSMDIKVADVRHRTDVKVGKKQPSSEVIQLSAMNGTELLLSSENSDEIRNWFQTLSTVIKQVKSEFSPTYQDPREMHDTEVTEDSFPTKPGGKVSQGRPDSMENGERRGRIKERLRQFLRRRPTAESLKERGILKDPVLFGSSLREMCAREHHPTPRVVKVLIEAIEKKGIDTDGLYRVPGNLSSVQTLRFLLEQGQFDAVEEYEVHVLTGTLKLFFRELREPLFPYVVYNDFINASKSADYVPLMRGLVTQLPHENRMTLVCLLQHLLRVTECTSNRMQVQNVAIVFGPTLMSSPPSDASVQQFELASHLSLQNRVIEILMTHFHTIFAGK